MKIVFILMLLNEIKIGKIKDDFFRMLQSKIYTYLSETLIELILN